MEQWYCLIVKTANGGEGGREGGEGRGGEGAGARWRGWEGIGKREESGGGEGR